MLADLDRLPAAPDPVATPALRAAADRAVALANDWRDDAARELFADNVADDESFERRAAEAARAVARHGSLAMESLEVDAPTRGDVVAAGGLVRIELELNHEDRVQWWKVSDRAAASDRPILHDPARLAAMPPQRLRGAPPRRRPGRRLRSLAGRGPRPARWRPRRGARRARHVEGVRVHRRADRTRRRGSDRRDGGGVGGDHRSDRAPRRVDPAVRRGGGGAGGAARDDQGAHATRSATCGSGVRRRSCPPATATPSGPTTGARICRCATWIPPRPRRPGSCCARGRDRSRSARPPASRTRRRSLRSATAWSAGSAGSPSDREPSPDVA